jgi:Kdo2-lipid IVA lauroyltransferase/acyltransferase
MGERIVYYLIVNPLSYLPLWLLYRFSDFFYFLLITIFPYRKKVISENLKNSFPGLTEIELKKLRKRFYRHFADMLIEGIKNLSISEKELKKRIAVVNPEVMGRLYQEGKNVLLVSGHYGNWEWLIKIQNKLFKHQAYGIGMPMTSGFWDNKVNEQRQALGMRVIHAKNYKEELRKEEGILKAVLLLSDQSPGDSLKSYWTRFLNQQTAVLFGAEMMAHELNYAVVFFSMKRSKRGYYNLHLSALEKDVKSMSYGEITEWHTNKLEALILEEPEQWLWSHKRWKREIPEHLEALKLEQNEKFNQRFKS